MPFWTGDTDMQEGRIGQLVHYPITRDARSTWIQDATGVNKINQMEGEQLLLNQLALDQPREHRYSPEATQESLWKEWQASTLVPRLKWETLHGRAPEPHLSIKPLVEAIGWGGGGFEG